MNSGRTSWIVAALASLALFTGVVLLIIGLLPRPLSRADYFVAGSMATLLVLLVIFLLLVVWFRRGRGRRGC